MSTGSLSAFSHPGCCSRTEADLHRRSEGCRAPLPWPANGPPLHLKGAKRRKLTQALSSLAGRALCHSNLHGQIQPSRATVCCAAAAAAKGPVVVIDNYDSFTYNLCQYLGNLGCNHIVLKNDEKTVEEIRAMNPLGVLVSPGPGRPEDSGISLQAVRELGKQFPLFGVCMGHQCIGQAFGGRVVRAPCGAMHGKTSLVHHTGKGVLQGLENPFQAARYHSLVIADDSVPSDLEVTAWTDDGTIMAVMHRQHPHIQGVQFHPESIITSNGLKIVENFILGMNQATG